MKYKIETASNIRGFIKVLFESNFDRIEFFNDKPGVEITGTKRKFLRKIFESKFFDKLGIVQVLRHSTKYDAQITYNRFMFSNSPYYIICENPTALFHYKLNRKNGLLARHLLPNRINDVNLRGIACISEACRSTFSKILGIESSKIQLIYPLIKDTGYVRLPNYDRQLNCLFVSSTFVLKSGCELVEVAKELPNVKFTFITRITDIPSNYIHLIEYLPNIELKEFKLSKEELAEYYKRADMLVHVTRQDSFGLVVLEAIKYGLPVLGSNIYAIPEMVIEGINGYLIEPRFLFFGRNNMPNPEVWNNRSETIESRYIDENIIKFLINKIKYLDEHRDVLYVLSQNSLKLSVEKFGERKIKSQWENLICKTININSHPN